jgi:hypothetical protein
MNARGGGSVIGRCSGNSSGGHLAAKDGHGKSYKENEPGSPESALELEREVRLDQSGIGEQREQRADV